MSVHYRVTVAGPVSRAAAEAIRARFGRVGIHPRPDDTVLGPAGLDQPALRALLTLLWDGGHEVRSVSSSKENPS